MFVLLNNMLYVWDVVIKTKEIMITVFQIVVNNLATKFTFGNSEKDELVNKMVELQEEFPKSKITFLKNEL